MSRRKRTQRDRLAAHADRPNGRRPAGDDRVRTALTVLVAVKVAGLILIFDPASSSAFEVPKTAFSLATASLLLAIVAIVAVRSALTGPLTARTTVAAAAVLATSALATVFAQDRYVALYGDQRRLGLVFVLDMAVLLAAVSIGFRSRRDWAVLAAAVAAAGAVSIAYGFAQSLGLDPLRWADDVRARPASTFGNPDKFGHFLGSTFAAALTVAALPGAPWSRQVRVAAAAYAVAAAGMAAVVATRGTVVGVLAAIPALGLLYVLLGRRFGSRRVVARGAAAAVGVLAITAAMLLATPLGERVRGGFGDIASQQRLLLADTAVRAFADRPITGHGVDNFGVIYARYRPAAASPYVGQDSAHSWPLQALATVGLPGALSLAALAALSLLSLFGSALARRDVAAPLLVGGVAYWAQGLVAFGSVSIDWIGWLVAGGAVAVAATASPRPSRRIPGTLQAGLIAAALVVALSGYATVQAAREVHAARSARTPDEAVRAARRAVELDGGRAEHWFALGSAERQRRDLAEAARAYREAAERGPHVAAYWSNLAATLADVANRGDQSLGGKGAALEAARRGVAADPRSARPHVMHAVVANALGEPKVALDAIAEAIRLDPTDPEYDAVAAQAALRIDPVTARAALERLIAVKDSATLRVALAQAALRGNDMAAARSHLARALALDPQHQAARELARQLGP